MTKPNFFYRFRDFAGRTTNLVVESLGSNTIEEVVKEISRREKIELNYRIVVFKNQSGTWDGYNVRRKEIITLNAESWPHAIENYITTYLNVPVAKERIA